MAYDLVRLLLGLTLVANAYLAGRVLDIGVDDRLPADHVIWSRGYAHLVVVALAALALVAIHALGPGS